MNKKDVYERISKLEDINTIDNNLERLILLRMRLNYKRYEMARLLDISYSYYGQIESGKLPLTDLMLKRINDILIREKRKYGEDLFSEYE